MTYDKFKRARRRIVDRQNHSYWWPKVTRAKLRERIEQAVLNCEFCKCRATIRAKMLVKSKGTIPRLDKASAG